NVANSGKGATFQALHLISGPKNDFASYLDAKNTGTAIAIDKLSGVAVLGVQGSPAPPRMVHEPGTPKANADGFVSYPAIDQAGEMTEMMKTSRAYEADIVAMNSAREMYTKALQLGERS